MIGQCEEALRPAGEKFGTGQLLACLTLVAPSGLTASDRNEWVRIAKETLTGMPGDLLQRGCQEARMTCRFPSEVVPSIVATVRDEWERRKRDYRRALADEANGQAPRIEQETIEYATAAHFAKLVRSLGGRR